jgi:hypothetical protein
VPGCEGRPPFVAGPARPSDTGATRSSIEQLLSNCGSPGPVNCPHPAPTPTASPSSPRPSRPSPCCAPLLARRRRGRAAPPGQPHRPGPADAPCRCSRGPRPRPHLGRDRPATRLPGRRACGARRLRRLAPPDLGDEGGVVEAHLAECLGYHTVDAAHPDLRIRQVNEGMAGEVKAGHGHFARLRWP